MTGKAIPIFSISDFLYSQNIAIAAADKNLIITDYNNQFKSTLNISRIKGKSLNEIFNQFSSSKFPDTFNKKHFEFLLDKINHRLTISVINSRSTPYYILRIDPLQKSGNTDLINSDQHFQNELENILMLMVKDYDLKIISEEILVRSAVLSKSDFSFVVFIQPDGKHDYQFYNFNNIIGEQQNIINEVNGDLSFINKWLDINKRSLLISNDRTGIGYNLSKFFNASSIIITPCIFDKKLLANIINVKKTGSFSQLEINYLEQFATLLSFAISNIRMKNLNEALESRLLQAQKLETIGKLSSGMAHDFSNLLSSIFGSINLLKSRVPQDSNVLKLLDNIENCSIRARDLTKGLLSFGKPTPKRKELVRLNELFQEISKVITQTFPSRIELELNIKPELFYILGNSTEIYQILLNLCVNAKEAIPSNGKIILCAENVTVDETNIINYPLFRKGNYIKISVEDSGSGIKEADIIKIFDPYFSTKQKDSGSGLGLYVTYGIIKAHGGYVEVSSKLNFGTKFEVFLPAYEPTKIKADTAAKEKIILLADDEVMLRDLLSELLEANGYNVIKVSSGIEALSALGELKIDLAIIDFNMPGMNGLDTIAKMRELKFTFPIILSSGSLGIEIEFDLKKYKVNGQLLKPYEFETMLTTIQKLI
ncbi:MAG: response regulator [Ignavibacteriales bacterium]|nr:response regulator [Ignavibacteriales bacterium]